MQDAHPISAMQDQAPPKETAPKAHRLKSISVVGGFLAGVRLDSADGLNCIIGAPGHEHNDCPETWNYSASARSGYWRLT